MGFGPWFLKSWTGRNITRTSKITSSLTLVHRGMRLTYLSVFNCIGCAAACFDVNDVQHMAPHSLQMSCF